MSLVVETVGLTRRFRRTAAVNGVSLKIPAGSIFALVGPNGAGKTTTVKLLLNLLRPTSGYAIVLGTQSTRLGPSELARIGYVSENQQIPSWMTPRQFVEYVRPFYPTWDDGLHRKLLDVLRIDVDKPIRTLSRGGRMKTALLASLSYRPELVVLDEPFTGLDPLVRDELIRAVLELAGEHPWTTLISSHDLDEVERLADSLAFIDAGEIVFTDSVQALVERHRLPLREIFVEHARRTRARAEGTP